MCEHESIRVSITPALVAGIANQIEDENISPRIALAIAEEIIEVLRRHEIEDPNPSRA